MNAIVDNRARQVGDVLRQRIGAGSRLSVVSAYFTIYAYEALRGVLEKAAHMRFLYGEPRGVAAMDPGGEEARSFRLSEDGGIELRQALAQRPLARACGAWIERRVDIRTVRQANFLHGKMYHVAPPQGGSAALAGSSNFTRRGLGFGAVPNIELNLEIGGEEERQALLAWFDGLWENDDLTRDAKEEVLAALARLGKAYAPEFVYYKTLFHIFEDWLAERGRRDGLLHDVHLYDTEIWKRLYPFQRDGATSAINRLLRHNGCIVADSVGLGKTWTALAVIRFFELRNERVLVLCPKKLQENWLRYTSWAGWHNNPFARDRLNYTVLAHTDLSRSKGKAGQIDLARFHWGSFDLVVIDESHNFRNEGSDHTDDEGRLIRRSRYGRLLEEIIKSGVKTKVLMLSATPVNTSLRDLRNQIYLMTEKRRDTFRDTLGIGDIQDLFGVAQRAFLDWEKKRRRARSAGKETLPSREELIESLGTDFLTLLDAVTIARSRVHLRRFYPGIVTEVGGFPERAKPVNRHPPTDRDGAISYDDLHARIGAFRLAVYAPSQYVRDTSQLDAEKEAHRFDQRDRERFLIAMMRVNLLKRLESSVHAFALTMKRILDKMEELENRIEAWRAKGDAKDGIDSWPDADEEDEEFAVGRAVRYRFAELDIDRWRRDLEADRQTFADLKRQAEQVTPERDAKLTELLDLLADKAGKPTRDKDGWQNRKALVFTAFADTARYLYRHVAASRERARVALVTGSGGNASTVGARSLADILERFAPRAQERREAGGEIDFLIATDCLSEGQNLQDCDLVVNYDIHWNPVRLMQRFGRIDRLGSRNRRVVMTNFWPTRELDRYLDLKNRVEARMALADAAATGLDDPLDEGNGEAAIQGELAFRNQQLQRLRDEILDVEEAEDGIAMSDLTLDDFVADLLRYVETNRAALEAAPFGICAVADGSEATRPGAIFCLKQKTGPGERTANLLRPWFLVHVRDDGGVRYGFRQARQCLALFRQLAAGRTDPDTVLEAAFDRETKQGQRMEHYERLLEAALHDIASTFRKTELRTLGQDRGAKLTRTPQRPEGGERFELATWLVVAQRPAGP